MSDIKKNLTVAFITGVNGQDGSYLAELLLEKNYIVYGLVRRTSVVNTERIRHLLDNKNLHIVYGDITDSFCLFKILNAIKTNYPSMSRLEVYNLAAQSHVQISFEMSEYTTDTDATGTLKILEALRLNKLDNIARFYQASTSELYGKVQQIPQDENTPFYPRSPYAVAKLYSFWIVKNYREAYGMYACNGILFNHESPRRGYNFVTRKITLGLSKILKGEQDKLVMGNINSFRDWGYAKDYVKGMWLMLQQDKPDDYVLATGEMHTVKKFIEEAFSLKGITIEWKGEGVNEVGYDKKTEKVMVCIDEKFYRPSEVDLLLGNPKKAMKELGWKPEVDFKQLVRIMVESDCS